MAPKRSLKRTPSNTAGLTNFQKLLLNDLSRMEVELLENRVSFTKACRTAQQRFQDNLDPLLDQVASVRSQVSGTSEEAGREWATKLLEPRGSPLLGLHETSVLHWRYDDESMWRGSPDNPRVVRLARSMITSGFREDSVVAARSLDLSGNGSGGPVAFQLLFGDGSARGVAAFVTWLLVCKNLDSLPCDEAVENMVQSLLTFNTIFEAHGDGSPKDALIVQRARQNQCQYVLPVSTFEWIGLVVRNSGVEIGSTTSKAQLLAVLEDLTNAYNQHPDVESYAAEPAAKKLKGGRKANKTAKAPGDDEGHDVGLKIGFRRMTAMRNFLSGGTATALGLIQEHLLFVGDYKGSVFTDDLLRNRWLYVGSHLPKEEAPSELELAAVPAFGSPESFVPKGQSHAVLNHDTALTSTQFDLMINKAIKVFEADTAHMERVEDKARNRPKDEQWLGYRKIIQRWTESMEAVCKKDLSSEMFDLLAQAVLEKDVMDQEFLSILDRRPHLFFVGMLPTCSSQQENVDEMARIATAAVAETARVQLNLLAAEMQLDWAMLEETRQGNMQLREFLRWLELDHRRKQVKTGSQLVQKPMAKLFPTLAFESWSGLPGALSLMVKSFDPDLPAGGVRRLVVVVDFNTPFSRDSLKQPAMIAALATVAKMLGLANCVVLAWMPNVPKEGSSSKPEEDETDLSKAFAKAGFTFQQRIRQVVTMHSSVALKTSELDWRIDGRLLSIPQVGVDGVNPNFFMNPGGPGSELSRTRRVMQEAPLPQSKDLVSLTSLSPDEEINVSDRSMDVAAKVAQRGPGVAEVQLQALFHKLPLSPKDETIILDPLPYVGDRVLGTYEFCKSLDSQGRGRIRHIICKFASNPSLAKAAAFSEQRLSTRLGKEWLNKAIVLHDAQESETGGKQEVPVFPNDIAPPPTEDQLRQCGPGALVAYRGLSALNFKTLYIRGATVQILPERLGLFQGAPLEIADELDKLKAKRESDYQDALKDLVTPAAVLDERTQAEDHRADPVEPAAGAG